MYKKLIKEAESLMEKEFKLFDDLLIQKNIQEGDVLDFTGIKYLTSAFLMGYSRFISEKGYKPYIVSDNEMHIAKIRHMEWAGENSEEYNKIINDAIKE